MATFPSIQPAVAIVEEMAGPPQGTWDYPAYAQLPEDGKRHEVIAGVLFMAPAPGSAHQDANALFVTHLTIHVRFAGLGRVFGAPYDVELAPGTIVQPDIVVVLNRNREIITPSRIIGTPDLVVEIASPATAGYDRREKQDAYARAGVPEYWIADTGYQTIEILTLGDSGYLSKGIFHGEALLPSAIVPTLPVPVVQFFGND